MKVEKFPLASGLWLVGVPIGSARDITLRALDVLASADVLVAEDTRSLRKLMDIHGLELAGRRLFSLHDHSGTGAVEAVLGHIRAGQSVAYASEAGMPLIADPGFELVRAVRDAGHMVTSAPGPTAVTTALALGGLATDAFHFAGFLPAKTSARQNALKPLRDIEATLVLYESPKRLAECLKDAERVLGPDRDTRVCRELTKKFEEVLSGSLEELAHQIAEQPVKGEVVVLIARAHSDGPIDIEAALLSALETMSIKDAARFVAEATGAPKRDVYQRALSLKR